MKVTQIFGLVLLFHLVAISLILLQPGCQTRQPPPPPDGLPQTAPAGTSRPTTTRTALRGDYVPESARHQPSRPAASQTGESNGGLDPAFNAGLAGSSDNLLQPVLAPVAGGSEDAEGPSTVYTVAPGDNLSRIAREYGVTINAIKNANNLTSNTIRVGQELVVPAPAAPTQSSPVDAAGSEVYTVSSGDTLSRIASRYGVTVTDLKSNNGLTSDTIRVGQELYIPEGGRSPSRSSTRSSGPAGSGTSASTSGQTYTVQPGDTPSGIARRYGVNYRELMRINNIASASRMQVGQELIIPAGGSQGQQGNAGSVASSAGGNSGQQDNPRASRGARAATLAPQTSQPARIGQSSPPEPEPAEEFDEFDLLENSEIPLMEVEVVEDPDGDGTN